MKIHSVNNGGAVTTIQGLNAFVPFGRLANKSEFLPMEVRPSQLSKLAVLSLVGCKSATKSQLATSEFGVPLCTCLRDKLMMREVFLPDIEERQVIEWWLAACRKQKSSWWDQSLKLCLMRFRAVQIMQL